MAEPARLAMSSSHAQEKLPDDVRNRVYAALLSGHGIPHIENTLKHEMQATGFMAALRAYINHLLRNEALSSMPEILNRVEAKVLHDTQAAKTSDTVNGANGVNGHNSDGDEFNLALPSSVTKEGTRTLIKELEKVMDITVDEK